MIFRIFLYIFLLWLEACLKFTNFLLEFNEGRSANEHHQAILPQQFWIKRATFVTYFLQSKTFTAKNSTTLPKPIERLFSISIWHFRYFIAAQSAAHSRGFFISFLSKRLLVESIERIAYFFEARRAAHSKVSVNVLVHLVDDGSSNNQTATKNMWKLNMRRMKKYVVNNVIKPQKSSKQVRLWFSLLFYKLNFTLK